MPMAKAGQEGYIRAHSIHMRRYAYGLSNNPSDGIFPLGRHNSENLARMEIANEANKHIFSAISYFLT